MPLLLLIFIFATSQVFQLVFGLSYEEAMIVFLLIVLGSMINIPIYEKQGDVVEERYSFFGLMYSTRRRNNITVAINMGGCVIPLILAIRLLIEFSVFLWLPIFAITSFVIYWYASPVQGLGIAVPTFIPPITATLISYMALVFIGGHIQDLPKLAFSTGVLSALFGADILHLRHLNKIGSGVMSIGGAGTFDGIFLTGVFAVVFSIFLI
ncbi:MAG: DUF1614 domain-containing protein [Halobacteriota archaeon]